MSGQDARAAATTDSEPGKFGAPSEARRGADGNADLLPGSECRRCGHKLDHLVREIEWGWLERCPSCTAYDWSPEPVLVKRSFEEAAAAGDV